MSPFFSCKADVTVSISFQLMGGLSDIMYVNQVPQWPTCFLHDKQWIADGFPGLQTPIHMHPYIRECLSFSSIPSGFLVSFWAFPSHSFPAFPFIPFYFSLLLSVLKILFVGPKDIIVVQLLSRIQLFATPWTAARQASLSFTTSLNLLRLVSNESVMPSNHLILVCRLLLLPSVVPSIRVFTRSWLLTSSGQSIGASTSASVLPMNIQGWFPLGLTGLICLLSKGLSRIFSSFWTTVQKHQFFGAQPSLWSSSHIYTWLLAKL